jgi:hypothetical protein
VDRNPGHAIVVAEGCDKRGGLPCQCGDARIAEQPLVARDLDQDLFQALRKTASPALLCLAGTMACAR